MKTQWRTGGWNCAAAAVLWSVLLAPLSTGIAAAGEPLRQLAVDAGAVQGQIRSLQGVDGVPVGAIGAGNLGVRNGPNLVPHWRKARVDFVRSYIWLSRLDTVDNPGGLFPRWRGQEKRRRRGCGA